MNNNILFKPNTLIRGILDVHSNEYKAFNLMLQKLQLKIQRGIKLDSDTEVDRITINEFKEIFKDNNSKGLKNIEETLDKLQNVKISFIDKNGIPTSAVLIPKVKAYEDEQSLGFFMDKEVIEIFKDHALNKKEFSPLNLTLMKKAKGFYSQRLYELLRAWSGQKDVIEISIKTIKEKLSITDRASYNLYKNLNSAVLKPAINEINKKFNMSLTYKGIKTGNKTTAIRFYIQDKEPRYYSLNQNNHEDNIESNKNQTLLAESTINRFIKNYGQELVSHGLKALEEANKKKTISAPKRYLESILKNKQNTKIKQDSIISVNNKSNFTQRQYDYEKLELQLLGWNDENEEYEN